MRPLTTAAFDILVGDLEGYRNVLSEMHRKALLELVDTFTDYVEGATSGRKAFALPTGTGKTCAIAAFVAALHRLDIKAAVAVAASKVEALCDLKRDFIQLGVPASKIGLKHSLTSATEPSTGNASRPYQLITHARVRSGKDFELFGRHEGAQRSLLIYDETLFRSDVVAVDDRRLRSAYGALVPLGEGHSAGSALALAIQYLGSCVAIIQAGLTELRERDDRTGRGLEVQLEPREPSEIKAYVQALRNTQLAPTYAESLEDLLDVSQKPLHVFATERNAGVIWISEVVPRELRNVVILDASHPIRKLAGMDSSVELMRTFTPDMVKSFGAVKIVQLVAGGGRVTTEAAAASIRREKAALSLEVIDIVKENWETASGILIFTFKQRTLDIVEKLREDLRLAAFDTTATGPDGRPRIQFLTWGEETSLNGYEYCDVVIMAGVLRRSDLNVAAEIRGQKGDRAAATPIYLVRNTVESEVAHVIYQGASRGSCRRIDNGNAKPMKLYFVHRHVGIRHLLDQVMPGAEWEFRQPKHLKAGKAAGVVVELVAQLLTFLRSVPDGVRKVSSKKVKLALDLADSDATNKAFTRAAQEVTEFHSCGWALEGRSLVRRDLAFYFPGDHG